MTDHHIKDVEKCIDFIFDNKDYWGSSMSPGIIMYDIHDIPVVVSKVKPMRQVACMSGLDLWTKCKGCEPSMKKTDATPKEAMDWLNGK